MVDPELSRHGRIRDARDAAPSRKGLGEVYMVARARRRKWWHGRGDDGGWIGSWETPWRLGRSRDDRGTAVSGGCWCDCRHVWSVLACWVMRSQDLFASVNTCTEIRVPDHRVDAFPHHGLVRHSVLAGRRGRWSQWTEWKRLCEAVRRH